MQEACKRRVTRLHVSYCVRTQIQQVYLSEAVLLFWAADVVNDVVSAGRGAYGSRIGVPERGGSIAISGSTKSISPTCTSGLVSAGAG